MELRHLRSFLVAAETEHFGRAAARLHVVQPALSKQMRELETEIGAALFERLPRGVRLTAAGREFAGQARVLLDQLASAVAAARDTAAGRRGRLFIGHVDTALHAPLLPKLFAGFQRTHPGVTLELLQHTSLQQADLLRKGTIDLAFAYHRPDRLGDLAERPVLTDKVVLAVPPAHRLARKRTVAWPDLRRESFVWIPRDLSPAYHDLVFSTCRRHGFQPKIVQESRSDSALLSLVQAGTGLTFCLASTRHRRPQGVVLLNLREPLPPFTLSAYWRSGNDNPALPLFTQILPQGRPLIG